MAHFVERTYPGYEQAVARWEYSFDTYTGAARDKALTAANAMPDAGGLSGPAQHDPDARLPVEGGAEGFLGRYLFRRRQGEHATNFKERARLTRFPMHFYAITAAFLGALSEVDNPITEEEADEGAAGTVRSFGVMGDAETPGTVAQRFAMDADGQGSNLSVVMTDAGVEFIVGHDVFYGVLPPSEDGGLPCVKLLSFPSVTGVKPLSGRPRELIVREKVDTSTTLEDEHEEETQYVHYRLDGWTRYRVTKEGDAEVIGEDTWRPRGFTGRDGQPRLPFGRLKLALRFPVGLRVAEGNIALYNLLSDVRNLIRVANHPLLKGEDLTGDQFDKTIEQRKLGSNMLLGNWSFISPNPSNFQGGYEVYRDEVREYYVTALQQYNDAPKVMTATQTVEQAKGRTAFLSLLAESLDEMENDILFLASQITAPSQPARWNDAFVRRSRQFGAVQVQGAEITEEEEPEPAINTNGAS